MTMFLEVENLNEKVLTIARIKDIQFLEIRQKVLAVVFHNNICVRIQPGDTVKIFESGAICSCVNKVVGTGPDEVSFEEIKKLLVIHM